MRFSEEFPEDVFRKIYGKTNGADTPEPETSQIIERYLTAKSPYIRAIKQSRRSKATTHAWRKFRKNFESGMHRYYRSPEGQLVRQRMAARMKRPEIYNFRDLDKSDAKRESVYLEFSEYENLEFLEDLSRLRTEVLKTASAFAFEEEYIDSSLFAEEVCRALSLIELNYLQDAPVRFGDLEALLAVTLWESGETGINNDETERSLIESLLESFTHGNAVATPEECDREEDAPCP